jgi:hypothetical protein
MGQCCSCFRSRGGNSQATQNGIEMETHETNSCMCKSGKAGSGVTVSPKQNEDGTFSVSGNGSMIGSCALDCDTAYWEVIIGKNPSGCKLGVTRHSKVDNNLERGLIANETTWLFDESKHVLKEGDVVGLYWDQTDLPMLSFTVNGMQVPACAVSRVRPAQEIFPVVSVAGDSVLEVSFNATNFKTPPKSRKFSMIICATQLI